MDTKDGTRKRGKRMNARTSNCSRKRYMHEIKSGAISLDWSVRDTTIPNRNPPQYKAVTRRHEESLPKTMRRNSTSVYSRSAFIAFMLILFCGRAAANTIPSTQPTKISSTFPSSQPSQSPSTFPSQFPSLQPSSLPTKSAKPSNLPSSMPSHQPSAFPSPIPSFIPSLAPSLSLQPSELPSISQIPSTRPSLRPSLEPSQFPTSIPSLHPSDSPTLSDHPSVFPTSQPSGSKIPSGMPTITIRPSSIPSFRPSLVPSSLPSISIVPSTIPTVTPSLSPSMSQSPSSEPSSIPTVAPTYMEEIMIKKTFAQMIFTNDTLEENTAKASNFERAMESITPRITNDTDRVSTICKFISGDSLQRRRLRVRELQQNTWVTYTMEYKSRHTNVTEYDNLFQFWMKNNIDEAVAVLNTFGVDATLVGENFIKDDTAAPTISPSLFPTLEPSSLPSRFPSASPSKLPTLLPSTGPTEIPSTIPSNGPSSVPSIKPTQFPSHLPSNPPPPTPNPNVTIAAVSGSVGVGALLFIFAFCVHRKKNNEGDDRPRSPLSRLIPGLRAPKNQAPSSLNGGSNQVVFPVENANGNLVVGNDPVGDDGSMSSENSLISTGSSRERRDSDSDIEYNDDTYALADEFDKYKDQNLEKMRSEVEGMSSNFDGMMSQALTKALMDDMDDEDGGFSEMTVDPPTSMEIEATVLCDISDWLKKKEGAPADDRYVLDDAMIYI